LKWKRKITYESLNTDFNKYARGSIVAETYYYGAPLNEKEFD
jgi:hypothetical protein